MATAERPKMLRVLRAVFKTPRAVLLTEDHVIGWLAMDCTNLAFVMKRWIIEFPLSRQKGLLSRRVNKYALCRVTDCRASEIS
ncbi:hypothetical protein [Massilia sp. MS-15]|uniref:hypothetical protein n=1 Tax=Massilia sp. MS-15 TaxID=2878200 RepID=UPI001CD23452|nr:hypothetical protein [Massilia sp. MS-15]MCA1248387.1 hypothetical protein [Massilia sp. MS-15]